MSESIHGFIFDKDSDGIVTITMDLDGPVNAMNDQYRLGIEETISKLEAEVGMTGIVLASAKSTFFAGGDLKELASIPRGEEANQFQIIETRIKGPLRRLEKLQVPVVAAINGAALGGGLEICLACNYRVMWNSPKVVIGLPESTLGLLPGAGGVVRSVHLLGLEKALPLLLEGTKLRPPQAHAVGYASELVDELNDLVPAAKRWIKANPSAWKQPWDTDGHSIPGGDISSPKIRALLDAAKVQTLAKTRGLLPAPERILSVASDIVTVDFESACRMESRGLAYLIGTPEASNVITSGFFQMNSINSGISRPKDIAPTKVKKIGILGAGMMGQGIAYSSAAVGIEVVLKDISQAAADKGKAYSAALLDKQIKRGRKTEADKTAFLGLIKPTDDYADFFNLALKAQVTKEAEPYLAEGGVFGSNTSTLPITQLAAASTKPDSYIGIHFFSPVDKMPLIEIICGEQTSDTALAKAFDYARQIRKTAIVVNDALGFFTSRVFGTFMDEGARLLVEGLDPVLIDAMGKQVGMPVGPLAVQDEISQELTRKAAEMHREMGVFCSLGDNSVNAEVSEKLIADYSRGGRFHGGGYYEYPKGGEKYIWPTIYELYHKPQVSMPEQDIKDRILFRQVIESLKCLQEGVLRSVADGNVGSILGIGAPLWTGGFIQFVNTYEYGSETGLAAFISRCNELAENYGERFAAPLIVAQKLQAGELFE